MDIDYRRIYVDLDSILDTRAGYLKLYDAVNGTSVFTDSVNTNYRTRREDSFPGLSKKDFREGYNKRDKRVLLNSVITPVMDYVHEYVFDVLKQSSELGGQVVPVVVVNTWPYLLSEEEITLIQGMVFLYTKEMPEVEMINLDLKELTTKYVRKNMDVMIKYDYTDWLDAQYTDGTLNQVGMPTVGLLIPDIYLIEIPPRSVFEKLEKEEETTPFKLLEKLMKPVIDLEAMRVDFFNFKEKL